MSVDLHPVGGHAASRANLSHRTATARVNVAPLLISLANWPALTWQRALLWKRRLVAVVAQAAALGCW
jgi:hypothetical protein